MTNNLLSQPLIDAIQGNAYLLRDKKITMGFDGFIDTIVRVVKQKDSNKSAEYFNTIREFGSYTSEKGKSFSLELEERATKLGGNMPIMANALANFGLNPTCIGPFGYPTVHPVFEPMSSNTRLHSFANPGITTALEFDDGKILMAQMESLNKSGWNTIKDTIGTPTITELFTACDLIGILNWSELDNAIEIWKGLLNDILPSISVQSKRPMGLFDLSDCSRRTDTSIHEALNLLTSFGVYWDVTLSLNLNEATIVYEVLTLGSNLHYPIEKIGEAIFQRLEVNTVLIHHSTQALVWRDDGMHKKENIHIKNPMLSTGAGDNFNAGFCAGRLMELDIALSIELGQATAGYYMLTGKSPTIAELLAVN